MEFASDQHGWMPTYPRMIYVIATFRFGAPVQVVLDLICECTASSRLPQTSKGVGSHVALETG